MLSKFEYIEKNPLAQIKKKRSENIQVSKLPKAEHKINNNWILWPNDKMIIVKLSLYSDIDGSLVTYNLYNHGEKNNKNKYKPEAIIDDYFESNSIKGYDFMRKNIYKERLTNKQNRRIID